LISLRKSVSDLERLEELEKREQVSTSLVACYSDCYASAIDSAAHFAVEIEPTGTAEFRKNLKAIEDKARDARTSDQIRSVQASLRGELREYRDQSAGQLKKLREQLDTATAAMSVFADTVTVNGANHEQEVQAELRSLESTAQRNDIQEIRKGISTALTGIEASVRQIQRTNQAVIVQLQDEIRALHLQNEREHKALYTDRPSGAWNRQKLDTTIDNLLRQNRNFCLMFVCLRNFKTIEANCSRTMLEAALKVMVVRLTKLAGTDSFVGRWSEDQFVAVLDMLPAAAISLCAEVTRKLSESYSIQEKGLPQIISLEATAGVLDRTAGPDSVVFRQKLQQLAGSITKA
jgi:GGDEF domain-containing protein